MKTLTFLFQVILLFGITILGGYSQSNNYPEKSSVSSNNYEYFPMEVGRFWKYKCIYTHSTTSSNTEEKEESEVLVRITSKKSDSIYVAQVTKSDTSSYEVTITVHENGDLSNEEGKLLLCQSRTSLDPDEYKSILGYPLMLGSLFTSSGNVNITESNSTLEAQYKGNEIRTTGTTVTTCEHNFDEKFEKGKGMIYTNYMKFITVKVFISGSYHYSGNLSDWTYTLTDYSTPPALSISHSNQDVASSAGSTLFMVTSNIPWTASSDQGWCTVTSSGTGNGTITATYQANTGSTIRTATITVSGSGVSNQTITVTQAAASVTPVLTITPSNQNVTSQAGTTPFTVTSNVAWTASSDQSWCTVTSSGTENGMITATYLANTGTSARTATITVTGSGVNSQTVTVIQAAALPILLPNLTPYKPSDWSDKIVVSKIRNTNTDDNITTSDSVFIDFALINNVDADISSTFYSKLYLDNVEINNCSTNGLKIDYYSYMLDVKGKKLSAGSHTVKLSVDATNLINEADEDDNTYTKTFLVSQVATGINVIENSKISIYPNPTSDGFWINGLESKAALRLYDIKGRLLLTKDITCNERVSISQLPKGTYIIKITIAEGVVEKKLIKN